MGFAPTSAQPCGCDIGARHRCAACKAAFSTATLPQWARRLAENLTFAGFSVLEAADIACTRCHTMIGVNECLCSEPVVPLVVLSTPRMLGLDADAIQNIVADEASMLTESVHRPKTGYAAIRVWNEWKQ